ncbi:glycosyltransferase family 2 protein [Candidatus Woesearchaeota archaeon]|jgi:glycosyltransferase involved in cell wall biosynthesis|nr:glycosyltransferase family 2 protein [Candidatus Woesearchaeota archaeon]MBT7169736.1 glycosyltransferase family 2 protein [Candidatus Woesearchaeota archaeon]MBT7786813.1 glycosyltransferase family 2 protein [Candidatus Woesearchaeota archaeon]
MKKLSVVVPMYNETNIYSNMQEMIKSLDKNFKNYEIILVDDGSTNDCFKQAKKIKSKKLKVVGYKTNKGKGNALKYGYNFVNGDYVTFIDADLDLHPDQIKGFFDYLDGADAVIGSKRHKLSRVHYPGYRRVLSWFYQKFIFLLFGLNLRDTQSGIKLFKKELLDIVLPKVLVKKYAFDLELLVNAKKEGFKVNEAPIKLDYKFSGTGINLKQIYYMLLDTLAIFYRLRILKHYDKK